MTDLPAETSRGWPQGVALSVLSGVGFYVLLQALSLRQVGSFEHMLDDVYIHLAMAAEIARGGYGVNPGEPASAASSLLYPLLLTPFAGSDLQRYLPVLWNLVGVTAASALWGAFVGRAVPRGPRTLLTAILLAAFGPLALHLGGIGFVGMEHALQLAATMAVLYGLAVFLHENRLSWLLIAGIVIGPMLRVENVGVSGMACAVLLFNGRPAVAILAGALALAPLAGFGWFLTTLGLDPVPNSLQTKFAGGGGMFEDRPLFLRLRLFLNNVGHVIGGVMLGLACLWTLAGLALAPLRRRPLVWIWIALVAVGLAHLIMGRVGELFRYEVYAVGWMVGLSILLVGPLMARPGAAGSGSRAGAVLVLIAGMLYYSGTIINYGPLAARTIHLQHSQMARFAQEVLKAPVAVNDLGRVVWRNPTYVLDLWGLASAEALAIRRAGPPPGWAAPLAARHGVKVAMIYDTWLGEAMDPAWVRLGVLALTPQTLPDGTQEVRFAGASDDEVVFLAIEPADVPRLAGLLAQFAAKLPEGVEFRFAPGIAEQALPAQD
ncbi:MAG: hypothetical protein AAGD12_05545 [Pseudomonadota bacterium]